MSKRAETRRWPVWLSLFVTMMLTVFPLPAEIGRWNPDWVALALIYWGLAAPGRFGVGTAWVAGLMLDVLMGTVLGQHALALTLVSFPVITFHLRLRVFPMMQQGITVFWLLVLYHFVMFWIDGIAGIPVDQAGRWFPIVTGTLVWPFVSLTLRHFRQSVETV